MENRDKFSGIVRSRQVRTLKKKKLNLNRVKTNKKDLLRNPRNKNLNKKMTMTSKRKATAKAKQKMKKKMLRQKTAQLKFISKQRTKITLISSRIKYTLN